MSTRGQTTNALAGRERPPRVGGAVVAPVPAVSHSPAAAGRAGAASAFAGKRALATSLRAAENRIATLPLERAYAFAPDDGHVIVSRQGQRIGGDLDAAAPRGQSVFFSPADYARMRGAVVTHNHPRGTSLSAEDIRLAAKHDFAQIRAVTTDRVYVLDRPKGGWARWDGPNGAGALYGAVYGRLADAWLAEARAGRVSMLDAERRVKAGAVAVLAQQIGARYREIPRRNRAG